MPIKKPSTEATPAQTEVEFGGMTFKGGKMFALITALSTLGGAAWGGFEFYNDYRNMKEIIQNIDTTAIENSNQQLSLKMDEQMIRIEEAIEYTRDIKQGLRDDILSLEKQVDRVEDETREIEVSVRKSIDDASERFDTRRDQLLSDYDEKADRLRDTTDTKIKDVELRLNKKLQRALDNPLAQ